MKGPLKAILLTLVLAAGIGTPMLLWDDTSRSRAGAAAAQPPTLPPLPPPLTAAGAPLATPRPLAAPGQGTTGALVITYRPPRVGPAQPTLHLQGPAGIQLIRRLRPGDLNLAGLTPGRWTLSRSWGPAGSGDGDWRREVEVRPGGREHLEIPAPVTTTLEGRVEGGPGLVVHLHTLAGWIRTRTDKEGGFRLTGLLPGPALVKVTAREESRGPAVCREITLQPQDRGGNRISLPAPRLLTGKSGGAPLR